MTKLRNQHQAMIFTIQLKFPMRCVGTWPLLPMDETLAYIKAVLERCIWCRLGAGDASEVDSYMYQFATFHEDMHTEAYTYSRQTLGYPKPTFTIAAVPDDEEAGAHPGDVTIPGGTFLRAQQRMKLYSLITRNGSIRFQSNRSKSLKHL